MSKNKEEILELDIAGLLSLKEFERPVPDRLEKDIQKTMNAVRAANQRPSLHFFPDKSLAWMFAQPRYGIAALFVLFLGLNLVQRPIPNAPVFPSAVEQTDRSVDIASVMGTNMPPPTAIPAMRPNYSSLIEPVSFTE